MIVSPRMLDRSRFSSYWGMSCTNDEAVLGLQTTFSQRVENDRLRNKPSMENSDAIGRVCDAPPAHVSA
jgi:hypothetical protein